MTRGLPDLTKRERFLLDWLTREDFSSLGECKGADLDALIKHGLAEISHPERGDYALVSATRRGFEVHKELGKL